TALSASRTRSGGSGESGRWRRSGGDESGAIRPSHLADLLDPPHLTYLAHLAYLRSCEHALGDFAKFLDGHECPLGDTPLLHDAQHFAHGFVACAGDTQLLEGVGDRKSVV